MSDFFEDICSTVDRPRPEDDHGESFWRMESPTVDVNGVITRGGMWESQRKWWSLPNFIKVYVGGFGAGKTLGISKRMVALTLQNAPCPCALVSPSYPVARHTTVATIASLLTGKRSILGRRFWWSYNATAHEFRIRYGGRRGLLIVYSGENPLSLRGPNLAAGGIDEAFIQDKEVFKQLVARIRHPEAVHKELVMDGTPEQLNWGYDICVGEEEKHDVGVVHASTRENLALDPGYVKRLEAAFPGKAADAYIEGKFVNLGSGLVYYAFDRSENVVSLNRPKEAELGAGMDFNVNPMAASVFWKHKNQLHFFDEIELPNADTEYMCSVLAEKYWNQGLRDIYPDATGMSRHTSSPGGKSDFHFIRRAGFTVNARHQNPLRKDRYNACNGKFKARSGRITLTVDPGCKKLVKYLSIYSHELMNKQVDLSHLLDSFSYPVAFLFPVDRESLSVVKLGGY